MQDVHVGASDQSAKVTVNFLCAGKNQQHEDCVMIIKGINHKTGQLSLIKSFCCIELNVLSVGAKTRTFCEFLRTGLGNTRPTDCPWKPEHPEEIKSELGEQATDADAEAMYCTHEAGGYHAAHWTTM